MMRDAHPMPAQLIPMRSGTPVSSAAATALATDSSSATLHSTNTPFSSSASCLPRSAFRSARTTVAPAAARTRAVASPRPDAPPEMSAAEPLISMDLTLPSGLNGTRFDGFERRAGDLLEVADRVVVPAGVVRAGHVPVRTVVRDEHPVALHCRADDLDLATEPGAVVARLHPEPSAHRRHVRVRVRGCEVRCGVDEAALGRAD